MRSVFNKIIRPDMIYMLWPKPNAGTVIEPKPLTFWLLTWDFKPLSTPDPLNPLRVHNPPSLAQKSRDAAIAITAILGRQLNDIRS